MNKENPEQLKPQEQASEENLQANVEGVVAGVQTLGGLLLVLASTKLPETSTPVDEMAAVSIAIGGGYMVAKGLFRYGRVFKELFKENY